jgi:hypothetical protein
MCKNAQIFNEPGSIIYKVPFIYYVITFRWGEGVKDKSKVVKKMSKIVKNCQNLSRIVKVCQSLSNIVKKVKKSQSNVKRCAYVIYE